MIWKRNMKKKTIVLLFLLFLLAAIPRLVFFNYPSELVFDELYFGEFVRSYFTHEHYFDIHPPFGKLLIAGVAKIAGTQLSEPFEGIGQAYSQRDLFFLRLLPLLSGIGLVLLSFFLLFRLTKSRLAAFLAGALVALDTAFLVHSRFILLDIPLLFLGVLSLYLFFLHKEAQTKKARFFLLLFSGLAGGAAVSIKWTGLAVFGMLLLLTLFWLFKEKRFWLFLQRGTVLLSSLVLVYVGSFALHFALLNNPGPGDAFFPSGFKEQSFFSKFVKTNKQMYVASARINVEHPYASSFKEWPLGKRPIFFWEKKVSQKEREETLKRLEALQQELFLNPSKLSSILQETQAIQTRVQNWEKRQEVWLVGNPIVWMLGLVSLFMGMMVLFFKKTSKGIVSILLLLWLANFLPFFPISRPLFLYHYFFSLLFSLFLFSYLFSLLSQKLSPGKTRFLAIAFLIAAGASFLFLSPLVYGLPFANDSLLAQYLSFLLK